MTDPLPTTVRGTGPAVLLLHGVGVGPSAYLPLADALGSERTVLLVHRPGYGDAADLPAASLAAQCRSLVATIRAHGLRSLPVLGISGGATLALALAEAAPELATTLVVHEPLLGPLAPSLHRTVRAAQAQLEHDPGAAAVERFVADLVGLATWEALGPDAQRDVIERGATVRAEVAAFAGYVPHRRALRALAGLSPCTTIGVERPSGRQEVADVLADLADARVVRTLTGHLAAVDDPEGWAACALTHLAVTGASTR